MGRRREEENTKMNIVEIDLGVLVRLPW